MPSAIFHRVARGALMLGAFALISVASPTAAPAAPAVPSVAVTVDARAGLATVPSTALGVNDAIWDTNLGTAETSGLLKAAGAQMLRYPGGSYADIYHWRDHTAPGGYVAPNTDFDTFMASVQQVGAEPMIIANYGTGTAEEAAGWVRYAKDKGYRAKYWTIGNENYGNGHYGEPWEADNHADKSPAAYAAGVVAFAEAMKAVDPDIKIGAVLTTPGNWPDGLVGAGDAGTWNAEVLSRTAGHIDFVDVHWYPGGGSAADALSKTVHVDDAIYLLRRQLDRYAGSDAGRIKISLTETNVGVGQNTQPGALFLADAYSDLLENGVFTVQWWNVHNGLGTVSTVAGQRDYGDFGMLSSGNCTADNSVCEPPLNTPFAPYHALKLLKSFVHTGDQLVRAGTDDPLVTAHAARRTNGDLQVLLVNRDPDNERQATLDYRGYSPGTSTAPTVISLGNGAEALQTTTAGTATGQTLAPYSLTLVTLHPARAGDGAPGAPGRPVAGTVTDRTATISWPAATMGRHPIAKYEVYRGTGGNAEQLGETAGTTFTARNLTPGTRYTVTVVARDTAGGVSWSSLPLTFTTGSPVTSSCTVRLSDTNDWGNGFVGAVEITNNGTAALSGWTLSFTWPTGWQNVQSGWSGTWTQAGRDVRVTSEPNASLAAGATTTAGFVGGYSGPNVLPEVFTLNGAVCHTG
jgi:hypothetical protein